MCIGVYIYYHHGQDSYWKRTMINIPLMSQIQHVNVHFVCIWRVTWRDGVLLKNSSGAIIIMAIYMLIIQSFVFSHIMQSCSMSLVWVLVCQQQTASLDIV